ncbi:MAG: helicase-exonuclease AddAB subunit AddB [Ruminococcaceae bacterium]|nr:helicase-exonuclease AddAB subunit AddB [Oscillospiraceae bacterium]
MSLTLIFGESGTGKSEYCTSSMQALYQKGIRTMMLVPEQFAHSSESRLMEKIGFISDDITSISFQRLAFKILKKKGLLKQSVSKIGKSMLLAKAILQVGDSLTLYKHAATKPGFVDSMLTFIAECKRSEITPEMLLNVSKDDTFFSTKLKELSFIYSAYQSLISSDYTDGEDYLPLLASTLSGCDDFRGVCIFIDEFFRFTPAEMDCIRGLLESGAEVYVTLGALPNAKGIFKPVIDTAKKLHAIAKHAGVPVNPPVILSDKHRFENSAELLHFEKEYRNYPHTIYKEETQDISLYIAPDLYTEVQVLAANICHTVQEKGYRYRDIAIVAGDPDLYADLIKTVFPTYNIPVFIDKKRSLLTHPIMVMLMSVFELLTKGIETETLMGYLKTGYAGLSADETDKLENFALSGRLKQKDWLDDARFLKQADSVFYETENFEDTHAEEAQELLALRDRVLSPLIALRNDLAESREVSHRSLALFRFFESIDLYNKVKEEAEAMKNNGTPQLAQEHSEVYNLLISTLDELVTCLGSEKIGMKRLQTIVSAGLSLCEMSTIPPSGDQVVLGDAGRSLVKNVKVLYVIGANAGSFPAAPPNEGLIKDAERAILENQGLSLGPDGKKIAFQNQYLVYSALTVSSNAMHVSYAVSDLEGKGLFPSPLVDRLRKLFPNLSVTDDLLAPPTPEKIIAGKQSAWQYILEHFKDKEEAASALRKLFADDPEYTERYQAMLRYSHYTHRVSDLSRDMAQKLYGRNLRGSVTQLEKYSSCPFSYFMRYGLRAKERKILKIDAPDIGHLLHKLVEIASQKITRENGSFAALDEDAVIALAETCVDELLSTLFIQHLYTENRLQALIKRLKAQLAKMLQMIVTHVKKGEFEPCAFEVAFDENGELPPVALNLPTGETITLIGRIDRIDVLRRDAEVYIKIIDYKTGNKSFRLSDIYNQLSLQLAVYLTAAGEGDYLGENIKPAGMFYFRLADQTVKATEKNTNEALLKQFKMSGIVLKDADIIRAMDTGISGYSAILPAYLKKDGTLSESNGNYATLDQFKKLSSYIRKTAGELGREILRGGTAISPCKNGDYLPCEYCRYHPVCAFRADTDPYRVAPPLKDEAVWEILSEEP